ncbi:MAG: cytochrome P450 [Acidimicrobiia bacterium]
MATMGTTPELLPLAEINISDPEFWLADRDYREAAFRTLRELAPVTFFEEAEIPSFPKGPGYWALTRFDDVWHASRNPQLFCSSKGTNIPDLPTEINEFMGSMINMDDPKHYRLRSIVSKGFTPKEVAKIEEYVKTKARTIVDGVIERFPERQCDFVEEIAAKLPLEVICEMMGIPKEDEQQVFHWTNVILGAGDPDYGGTFENLMTQVLAMFQYAQALGEDRLATPRDDITSVMMHAVVDGERLTASEFGSFFILLVVAGNETTRNAISHGMQLLTLHDDQRSLLWDDFDGHVKTAVEEIVRYATPVIHFRRTATEDAVVNGVQIAAGDKVVLWYNSANRDEAKFVDPYRFDITRDPNPHVGYGAGGPHFCLGANLARREISVMLGEIRNRLPELRITGEPAYLQSAFINGIKRLPCAW